jgi:iron complex transport system ATP-binding protein
MTALAFSAVSASYNRRAALSRITASIAAGSVTGLVGPNGAGKTTLLRVALGLHRADSGMVRVLDRPLGDWPPDSLPRAVAYLPQGSDAHWPIEARRLVALGRLPHRAAFAPLSAADNSAIGEALARCDALEFARRRVDSLSAGERARVLLARALATRAPVLLVDEPAAHLDPAHQLRLMALLREEASRGAAVVVTLHDLALASRFCDELIVLKQGQVAASGAPDVALSDMALADVFGVRALRAGDGGMSAIVPWSRI